MSDEEKSLARRLLCTIASGLVFLFVKGVKFHRSVWSLMVGGVSDYKSLKVDSVMVCGLN